MRFFSNIFFAKLISEEQNSALVVEDIDGITVSDGQPIRPVYTVVPNFDD